VHGEPVVTVALLRDGKIFDTYDGEWFKETYRPPGEAMTESDCRVCAAGAAKAVLLSFEIDCKKRTWPLPAVPDPPAGGTARFQIEVFV
jgi:hypothetical protein